MIGLLQGSSSYNRGRTYKEKTEAILFLVRRVSQGEFGGVGQRMLTYAPGDNKTETWSDGWTKRTLADI